jgi:glutathione S-transferase
MLTLYHGKTSVCSIKARLALAEKGVAWEGRLLTLRGDQFDPDYMKLNPNAVVPTLVHDGKVVIESTVVMHYVDEAFPGPALVPADPLSRAKLRMTTKLMDEYVHSSCTTLTFATANRAHFARMSAEEFEAELAKSPDPKRSEIKRQVVKHGLEAPLVADALRHHEALLDRIEAAAKEGPFMAGAGYSLADAAATPYVAARQAQARAHVGEEARRRRLVRAHPRAAVVQDRGRGLGHAGRSRALRQRARPVAEGARDFARRVSCPPYSVSSNTRHVVVACASSRPRASVSRPSAVATRRPLLMTRPSARTRPVSAVIGRTRLTLNSKVV